LSLKKFLNVAFNADPDPSFHTNAGPDPASQNKADSCGLGSFNFGPNPRHCSASKNNYLFRFSLGFKLAGDEYHTVGTLLSVSVTKAENVMAIMFNTGNAL
jgi:hypothetical protein